MENQFIDFIKSEKLLESDNRILLGISGGVDSMVMLELFMRTGFPLAAAHCNFGLRAGESDDDHAFVARCCKKNNIPLHAESFETVNYAREKGISLQMAAREIRYQWFDRLAEENSYAAIAIAHNKNDLAETFLINLMRGTGIRGLTGIRTKAGRVIRPLLFACREEIIEYAAYRGVEYREDSSNAQVKYTRNRIRHLIIPEFEAISPGFVDRVYHTAARLRDSEKIAADAITGKFLEICTKTDYGYLLRIESLLSLTPLPYYLFAFLSRWNFTGEILPDILSSLTASSGKQFFSSTHRLIKDREHLIITPIERDAPDRYYIEEGTSRIDHPLKMHIARTGNHSGFIFRRWLIQPALTWTCCIFPFY
jgi:tRNA(Ile)-lysidine synthase